MASFIYQFAQLPFLLSHEFTCGYICVDEFTVSLAVCIVSNESNVFSKIELGEFALPNIFLPNTLLNLICFLVEVFALSILFVFGHYTFESVSISENDLTSASYLIIAELTLIVFFGLLDVHFSVTFFLTLDELSSILISISIRQDSMSPEMAIFELSFICLVFESVGSLTTFFILNEVSLIDCSYCFLKNTFTMFLSANEITSILITLFQHPQLTFAMKLIMLELSFVLKNTFQNVNSSSMLLSIFKSSFISSTIFFLKCTFEKFVISKFSSKFLPICIDELTILAALLVVSHLSCVLRFISVCDSTIDELTIFKLPFECTVFLFP